MSSTGDGERAQRALVPRGEHPPRTRRERVLRSATVAGASLLTGRMFVRPLVKRDFDHLVQVIGRCWGHPIGSELHPIHPVFFHELGSLARVVESGGCMLGFLLAFISPRTSRTGYVHLIGVHPDYRRQGLGTVLYQSFEESCLDGGCTHLRAVSSPENHQATAFHLANGWDVKEATDHAGPARTRLVYSKTLRAR